MTDTIDTFAAFPEPAWTKLNTLRRWLLEIADEHELGVVTESLKWGEPSFQVKNGSTVRMDWKPSAPDRYCVFFHCQSRLVETFRELYSKWLSFEGNRAIVFQMDEEVPEAVIKHCFLLALRYHRIKHLPLLGA